MPPLFSQQSDTLQFVDAPPCLLNLVSAHTDDIDKLKCVGHRAGSQVFLVTNSSL
jgi:hypothetical protein